MSTVYSVVTSKGQITLPARFRRKLKLEPGLRVAMREVEGSIVITPPADMAAVRAQAKAEMVRAGTWGTVIEADGAWADTTAQKAV